MTQIKDFFRTKRRDGVETRVCHKCREPVNYIPVLKRGEVDHNVHYCGVCGEYEGKTDSILNDSDFMKRV